MKNRSADFQKNRRELLDRYHSCELCGHRGELEVHHKIPSCFGGSDNTENLICICGRCHGILHAGTRSEMSKMGIRKAKNEQRMRNKAVAFYEYFHELTEKNIGYDEIDIYDYLDKYVFEIV